MTTFDTYDRFTASNSLVMMIKSGLVNYDLSINSELLNQLETKGFNLGFDKARFLNFNDEIGIWEAKIEVNSNRVLELDEFLKTVALVRDAKIDPVRGYYNYQVDNKMNGEIVLMKHLCAVLKTADLPEVGSHEEKLAYVMEKLRVWGDTHCMTINQDKVPAFIMYNNIRRSSNDKYDLYAFEILANVSTCSGVISTWAAMKRKLNDIGFQVYDDFGTWILWGYFTFKTNLSGLSPEQLKAYNSLGTPDDICEKNPTQCQQISMGELQERKDARFMSAVEFNDLKTADVLLFEGADVNHKNEAGFSALMIACKSGFLDMVKLLVSKGADVKAENSQVVGGTVLYYSEDHDEIYKFIVCVLAHGLEKCYKAVSSRVDKLQARFSETINVVDTDGNTSLMRLVINGKTSNIKVLLPEHSMHINLEIQNKEGNTALALACISCNVDIVTILLENGANQYMPSLDKKSSIWIYVKAQCSGDVEQSIYDAFHAMNTDLLLVTAAKENDGEAIKHLIGKEYPLNASIALLDVNAGGMTALMYACKNENVGIAGLLINASYTDSSVEVTDFNMQDKDGNTALMFAIKNPSGAIRLLIDAEADLNLKNNLGDTALIIATKQKYLDGAKRLIEAEAQLLIKNKEGKSALDTANKIISECKGNSGIATVNVINESSCSGDEHSIAEVIEDAIQTNLDNLVIAILNASLEDARRALHIGVDLTKALIIESRQTTFLIYAVPKNTKDYDNIIEIITLLIEGSDINGKSDVNAKNSFGRTALMTAALNGMPEIVQLLLDNKADKALFDGSVSKNGIVVGKTALTLAEEARRDANIADKAKFDEVIKLLG